MIKPTLTALIAASLIGCASPSPTQNVPRFGQSGVITSAQQQYGSSKLETTSDCHIIVSMQVVWLEKLDQAVTGCLKSPTGNNQHCADIVSLGSLSERLQIGERFNGCLSRGDIGNYTRVDVQLIGAKAKQIYPRLERVKRDFSRQ